MVYIRLKLTSFFEAYRLGNSSLEDDFEAFIACIDKTWQVTNHEAFVIEKMLSKELKSNCMSIEASILMLTYIRLCAVPNSIGDRAASIRDQLK